MMVVKRGSESGQKMPQSQIADQPKAPRGRDTEPDSHSTIKVKQSVRSSSVRLLIN